MEWLQDITYWHWWVLGIVLVILEIFSPAAFFLWLGISAGIIGFVLLLVPGLAWEHQLLVFAIFSILSIVGWRAYLHRHPTKTDLPRLNRRGEQYIDRIFTLSEPIVNGHGKIKVDDSTWKVEGEDCAAGTRVRVTNVEGVVLRVVLFE